MSTRNRWDLQTLGSQPVMPENLPGHGDKRKSTKSVGRIHRVSVEFMLRIPTLGQVTRSADVAGGGARPRPAGLPRVQVSGGLAV
jgi:hypothetical protein